MTVFKQLSWFLSWGCTHCHLELNKIGTVKTIWKTKGQERIAHSVSMRDRWGSPWTMAQRCHLQLLKPKARGAGVGLWFSRRRWPCSSHGLSQDAATSPSIHPSPRLPLNPHNESRATPTASSPQRCSSRRGGPLFASLFSLRPEKMRSTTLGSRTLNS